MKKSFSKVCFSAEVENESVSVPLSVEGRIPEWLTGTLVRNGPVTVNLDGKTNTHWFDGLAMLHAFAFDRGRVLYSNRFLRTDAFRTVSQECSLQYEGFAVDPCRSLFKRFYTWFKHSLRPHLPNAMVNVSRWADQYVALTETPLPICFDPATLETLGGFAYRDQLPKSDCWESAHPHVGEEIWNYLVRFGKTTTYTIYRIEEGERKVVSAIPVDEPSYMHSFGMTENYLILTEFPLTVRPSRLLWMKQAFIKNYEWHPERGTQFLIIRRDNGELVGRYRTRPFFAFHHVNAYEEGERLVLDLITYEDAEIITGNYFDPSGGPFEEQRYPPSRLERFFLLFRTGEMTSEVLSERTMEFPRIHPEYDGRPHRFVYTAGEADRQEAEPLGGLPLYKVDTKTKRMREWREEGCFPGEPVFVPSPDEKGEEAGLVLAVVIDRKREGSFLLVLDAQSFQEVARARTPYRIPAGLHGEFFKRVSTKSDRGLSTVSKIEKNKTRSQG